MVSVAFTGSNRICGLPFFRTRLSGAKQAKPVLLCRASTLIKARLQFARSFPSFSAFRNSDANGEARRAFTSPRVCSLSPVKSTTAFVPAAFTVINPWPLVCQALVPPQHESK
jgi:hypothetical protein